MNDTNTKVYGQLRSEKLAEENTICRQIAREISLFGITERQRLFLIYLLAVEIEDSEKMFEVTSFLKDVAKKEVFLSTDTIGEVQSGQINS